MKLILASTALVVLYHTLSPIANHFEYRTQQMKQEEARQERLIDGLLRIASETKRQEVKIEPLPLPDPAPTVKPFEPLSPEKEKELKDHWEKNKHLILPPKTTVEGQLKRAQELNVSPPVKPVPVPGYNDCTIDNSCEARD